MTSQRCDHRTAVPVESVVTGETLAALCPTCGTQLPAEFIGCPHANVIDMPTLGEVPGRRSERGARVYYIEHLKALAAQSRQKRIPAGK